MARRPRLRDLAIAERAYGSTASGSADPHIKHDRAVAAGGFTDAMLCNNARAWFVYDLYETVLAGDPEYAHDPQPRLPYGPNGMPVALGPGSVGGTGWTPPG
jgi:hypothetical protein